MVSLALGGASSVGQGWDVIESGVMRLFRGKGQDGVIARLTIQGHYLLHELDD